MILAGFAIIILIFLHLLAQLALHKNFKIDNKFLLKNKFYHYIWLFGTYCAIVVIIYTIIYTINLIAEEIVLF